MGLIDANSRLAIMDLNLEEVRVMLRSRGLLPHGPMLTEQAFRGVHQQLASAFHEIRDLSRRKVGWLDDAFELEWPELMGVYEDTDRSRRYAFRLSDGSIIESVLIPRHGRFTLCVSSQAGCALACQFCATGRMGLRRNLKTHEIVSQVLFVSRHANVRMDGVVFMGMGEPLQNESAVLKACEILTTTEGLQISPRKILISTAGIVPAIKRFAAAGHRMHLVFSLASAVPEKRARLMPIQKTYGFFEFLDAVRTYAATRRGKHVILEYIAIKGLTLGADDTAAILEHLVGFPFILDVIPFNPVPGSGLETPSREELKAWTESLRPYGFPVKVRRSAGQGRFAGCGQLGTTLLAAEGAGAG